MNYIGSTPDVPAECKTDQQNKLKEAFNAGFVDGDFNDLIGGGGEDDEEAEEVQYMTNVGHYIRAMTESGSDAVNYLQKNVH